MTIKMEITTRHGAIEGKTQTNEVDFYNLDAIIDDERKERLQSEINELERKL